MATATVIFARKDIDALISRPATAGTRLAIYAMQAAKTFTEKPISLSIHEARPS